MADGRGSRGSEAHSEGQEREDREEPGEHEDAEQCPKLVPHDALAGIVESLQGRLTAFKEAKGKVHESLEDYAGLSKGHDVAQEDLDTLHNDILNKGREFEVTPNAPLWPLRPRPSPL